MICITCKEDKPETVEYFYRRSGHRNGFNSGCKICRKKKLNNAYKENQEEYKAKTRKWRKENPEGGKLTAQKWRAKNPDFQKKRRHKLGINKHYRDGVPYGISYTKEYKKAKRHERKMLFKNGGELTAATVQIVYEDNIKRFGTLTCYLCIKLIPFGKDHLEHKIPLSRGGTNEYNNLGVACQHCNCKKHNKTVEEFLIYVQLHNTSKQLQ